MKTFTGTQTVRGGFYLNTREWKLESVQGESGTLPGEASTTYRRIPVLALLLMAPLMGLLFVIALPFIGLAVIGEQMLQVARATATARRLAREEARIPRN